MKKANELLDYLVQHLAVNNDRALGEVLKVAQPSLSKIRGNGKVSAEVILAIHEATGISIAEIKSRIPK